MEIETVATNKQGLTGEFQNIILCFVVGTSARAWVGSVPQRGSWGRYFVVGTSVRAWAGSVPQRGSVGSKFLFVLVLAVALGPGQYRNAVGSGRSFCLYWY